MRLKGKVAIITGAGGSQGRAATSLFAKEGAKVLAVEKNPETLEETLRQVKKAGGEATGSVTDIRKEEQVEAAVKLAVDTYGKLDVLYNNAAVDVYAGRLTNITEKTLDFVMGVNFKGYFFFCKHAIPEMIKAGGGSIINILSNAIMMGAVGDDAYTPSKSALIGLSRNIAAGYAHENIRCNMIYPGGIFSEGHKEILKYPEKLKEMSEITRIAVGPMERFGTPEDIAYCALWLASDESKYCSGAEIAIDGASSISRHLVKGDVTRLYQGPGQNA